MFFSGTFPSVELYTFAEGNSGKIDLSVNRLSWNPQERRIPV
jgi:hypothetical protein